MSTDVGCEAKDVPSVATTLMNIIPTNPFHSLNTQNLLQIIFFSLLPGFALIKLGDKGAPALNFFRAWTEAWKEITNLVLEFTPCGVFGLMANIVGDAATVVVVAKSEGELRTIFAPQNA